MESAILERIGAYLARENITKGEFADRAGIKRTTFYSRMSGDTEFSLIEGSKIANILGCTVDELLVSPLYVMER